LVYRDETIESLRRREQPHDQRQGAIQKQAGCQGREVYQDITGAWLVVIRWENQAAAEAWTPVFVTLKEGQAFGVLLDFTSARQEHYTLQQP